MTDPSDRPTAESLLRSRFPESEGWAYRRVEDFYEGEFHEVSRGRVSVFAPLYDDDGTDSISDWDAATHREQVRDLVRAARALIGEHPKDAFNGKLPVGGNIWMHGDWITAANTLSEALAALPDSMKED